MGAWCGWFPTDAEYDQLAVYELREIEAVIQQKMKGGL